MVPVSCKLCSSLGAKTEVWTLDGRKTHAQFHVFQSGYISEDGDQPSVKETVAECFPLESFDKSEDIEKNRSILMEICKHIIADKKNDSKSIKCQICGSNVRYVNKKGQAAYLILRHASSHSKKKPFACRKCDMASATKQVIMRHIKRAHKIDSLVSGVDFDENLIACFDEIKESLAKSFGVLDPILSVEIQFPPSELSMHRRSTIKNIMKRVNVARKIRCRQCEKEIDATSGSHLEDHIRFHLQQRIYDCSMCEETFIHKRNVARHLAKKHAAPLNGSYIDHSDEHHEAILDMAKKCFGEEGSK